MLLLFFFQLFHGQLLRLLAADVICRRFFASRSCSVHLQLATTVCPEKTALSSSKHFENVQIGLFLVTVSQRFFTAPLPPSPSPPPPPRHYDSPLLATRCGWKCSCFTFLQRSENESKSASNLESRSGWQTRLVAHLATAVVAAAAVLSAVAFAAPLLFSSFAGAACTGTGTEAEASASAATGTTAVVVATTVLFFLCNASFRPN